MKSDCKTTRAYLKKMPPNHAEAYLKSFNLPFVHERIMYYLYVKKMHDITLVKYELEEKDHIFISEFKAGEMHRQSIEWICQELKK